MRVFVASWFFPPQTSSEGIVTYKMLRRSELEYDVVCADSSLWGYSEQISIHSEHIHVIPVKTNELNTWKEETLRIFELLHKQHTYDVFMTRCMPNESLEIGLSIKEKHPELKWICSLADPVANNPYWIDSIEQSPSISDSTKQRVIKELSLTSEKWTRDWLNDPSTVIREQFYWKHIQDAAIASADLLITPSKEQRDYMSEESMRNKFLILPHSYDDFQDENAALNAWESEKTHFLFTGYSDSLRSLLPFVEATKWIQNHFPNVLSKIKIHFFGNYPNDLIDRAYAYQLNEVFEFGGNISYASSLAYMRQADWLLHVDAYFERLSDTGGSIFFAGKLADYMGSRKPVLALTGYNSPAGNIVQQYGGEIILPCEIAQIAKAMIAIATGKRQESISEVFRAQFDAQSVAKTFDTAVKKLICNVKPRESVEVFGSVDEHNKVLTVCVPSYNAQSTLKRTLDSLLKVKNINQLEVIIVDDGSTDQTAEIGLLYVNQYLGSVILIRKPNGGHGSGINAGIRHASGRYFRVVDSDDWVDTFALDAEIEYIIQAANTPDAIYTPYYVVDQKTGSRTPWPSPQCAEMYRLYSFEAAIEELGVENVYLTMAATSFRTALLKEMELELREKCFYTDSEFILKPIVYVNTVTFLPDAVYRYLRGQSEQSVAPLSFVKHYSDHEAIIQEMIIYEQVAQMEDGHRKYFQYILEKHLETNYQILLEFDLNINRSIEHMKCFDVWLREQAPFYYKWTQDNLNMVRAVRHIKYDVSKTQSLKKIKKSVMRLRCKSVKLIGIELFHSRLFLNRFTRKFILKQKENNGCLYRIYQKVQKVKNM